MLKIDQKGHLKKPMSWESEPWKHLITALSEYSDVFQGIGRFREKSTGKKIEDKL